MTSARKSLVAIGLVLMLALTSLHMAVARGQGAAVSEMALCLGGSMVVVPVDAQGNPTGPGHVCPDCALSFIVFDPASADLGPAHIPRLTVVRPVAARLVVARRVMRPAARAPPKLL